MAIQVTTTRPGDRPCVHGQAPRWTITNQTSDMGPITYQCVNCGGEETETTGAPGSGTIYTSN